MDFGKLLHVAKQNSDGSNAARCYNTKFSPPKKEQKDKNLSSGIKRFLAKKDEEDRAKERQNRENRERLEAMRDNKSKNKINKMLKVIKSANKSVVSDSEEAPEGPMQPDEDDYGYESQESSALYKRLMEKYKSPEDDIKNKSSSHTQMSRTTPIKRPPPVSVSVSKSGSSSTSRSSSKISQTNGSVRRPDNHKKTGTPVNDKNNGKPQLPTIPKIPKVRRPPPPVANFEALLKLAEQKQFEPIKTDQSDKSSRKDDRPMSAKEKREHEERMRMAEARKKRLDNDNYDYRKEDGSVDPKNRKSEGDSSSNVRPSTSAMNPVKRIGATSIRPVTATATSSGGNKIQQQSQQPTGSGGNSNKFGPAANKSQSPAAPPVKTRQFPPPDVERTRSFPPKDVARNSARPFPPADVRRKPPQPSAYTSREFSKRPRRDEEQESQYGGYEDYDEEDEDEYDSEMDDFIDDGPLGQADVSSCIKEIFGYDKSRYRDEDFDDREMESSFAQQMREESYSRKVGRLEDAADMRQEALDKARKAALKRAANRD